MTKLNDYTIFIIDSDVPVQEVVFKSQVLKNGHLYCPKKYAIRKADFKVIVSLPDEEVENAVRPFGLCRGEFRVPDDFDAPLLITADNIIRSYPIETM